MKIVEVVIGTAIYLIAGVCAFLFIREIVNFALGFLKVVVESPVNMMTFFIVMILIGFHKKDVFTKFAKGIKGKFAK